jgi:hypothetical protein
VKLVNNTERIYVNAEVHEDELTFASYSKGPWKQRTFSPRKKANNK